MLCDSQHLLVILELTSGIIVNHVSTFLKLNDVTCNKHIFIGPQIYTGLQCTIIVLQTLVPDLQIHTTRWQYWIMSTLFYFKAADYQMFL